MNRQQPFPTLSGPEVLIVVPTFNESAGIEACLRSLLHGDPRLERVALIVTDGGSTDGTQGIVTALSQRFPQIRLIGNPRRLQSAGINSAVRDCAGPQHLVVVRADAHAIYPPGYAMQVADRLLQTDSASVVVPMDSQGQGCFSRAAAWIVDTKLGSGGAAHRGGQRSGPVDHGHHAAMDLRWFQRIGGYDPQFSHNEDAELDHRLRQVGGRIWMAGDLRLTYQMRPDPVALIRQYWNYGRGRARTCRKHHIRPRPRQIAPALNLILLLAGLVVAMIGAFAARPLLIWAGLVWPLAYLALLAGASLAMALRHRHLCGLLAGPALAAMHLPWGAGFLTGLTRRRTP